MELIQDTAGLSAYLAADETVDHRHPAVRRTAARLADGTGDACSYAHAAYEFVRDTITHSADADDPRVTWRASDVLEQGTGICHAKAHALAALLRAGGIPAALCYQRLTDDTGTGHVLHGLVAVHLRGAWHRQDPRGNKPGVDARFSLEGERLAWVPDTGAGEEDHPVLFAAPHPAVLGALMSAPDRPSLWRTLPDSL
ncbi:transglutaminase domain-containing protein [Streptomyces sp. NPDC026659]|uniref:transglutaminase domain-containing protein n=1 Tax=Streptomyces sp. NPDC026659 TaxID=3155123 RepID=UPI0033CEA33E